MSVELLEIVVLGSPNASGEHFTEWERPHSLPLKGRELGIDTSTCMKGLFLIMELRIGELVSSATFVLDVKTKSRGKNLAAAECLSQVDTCLYVHDGMVNTNSFSYLAFVLHAGGIVAAPSINYHCHFATCRNSGSSGRSYHKGWDCGSESLQGAIRTQLFGIHHGAAESSCSNSPPEGALHGYRLLSGK